MPIVLDASVALSWCFEDKADDMSRALLDQAARNVFVVPPIWILEVGNVLLMAERTGRITRADSARFLHLLTELSIEVFPRDERGALPEWMELARRYGLTAYDAQYLLVAVARNAPLATRDGRLGTAANAEGVELWCSAAPEG